MFIKKIIATIVSSVCITALVSCSDTTNTIDPGFSISKNGVINTADPEFSVGENGVTDIINPDENSEEYSLGSYRISENGVKLYYEDDVFPTELMLTLEKYFTSFQNNDFELYKSCVASDYVERYDKYLKENYSTDDKEYGLTDSFELQCENLRSYMIDEIIESSDEDSDEDDYTGDFRITRIKAEETALNEDETLDSLIEKSFDYTNNVFDMDYYSYINENSDKLYYFTFYIIAEGEDGAEHRIISEMDILFAEKDGRYYTLG